MIKPLISYYGGKQRMASRIVEIIHKIPHTVYTEPFAGGCTVLFAKGRPEVCSGTHYREAINDINDLIVNLYRVARSHPDELQRRLELTLYSQAEYRRALEYCKNGNEDPIELAWAVYVNLQMSFAKKMSAGWGTSVTSQSMAQTWSQKQQRLPAQLKRLSIVHIGSEDALRFIQRWDSPQSLHYCDPPYPGTELGHYKGYTLDDFKRLVDALDTCQGSFILSNYEQPVEMPEHWNRVEIKAIVSASGKGTVKRDRSTMPTQEELAGRERTEVLWWVDRSGNARPDVAKVMAKVKHDTSQIPLFSAS